MRTTSFVRANIVIVTVVYMCLYTYSKHRCRKEQRLAVVERKLHDRKELWFPYGQTISLVIEGRQVYTDPDRCARDIRREGDKLSYRLRSLTRPRNVG